jgi:DNA-binding PadR family transcriptional regulator
MKAQDVILGVLLDGSKSGYDIKKEFEKVFSYFYDASFGSIYPVLKRIEEEGLIVKETIFQEGKPNKHVYSITDLGKEAFDQYLSSPVNKDIVRSDISMRLYFGHYAAPEQVETWLSDMIRQYIEALQPMEEMSRQYCSEMSVTQKLCITLGISSHRNEIATLKEGLKWIKEMNNAADETTQHKLFSSLVESLEKNN